MPTFDDEQFEAYLKQFRPLPPDALPISRNESAFSRYWVVAVCGGMAAMIILTIVSFRMVHSPISVAPRADKHIAITAPPQSLTMRDANALLATAPSYKAALDNMAFRRHSSTVPKEKQSALAVLAKERIKL